MAIKKILPYGTPLLRQKSKEVLKINKKIRALINDLLETMYANNGVGLAAPQIGEEYRVFVVDTSTGNEPLNPLIFINPKIIKKDGAIIEQEGCLSFPQVYTDVKRYKNITVKAINMQGKPFIMEAKEGSLLARAIQHENDHLDGILFIDHVVNRFDADEQLEKNNLPLIDPEKILEEPDIEKNLINKTQTDEDNND